jgi:predicted Zn finger-like uncharacterized protein
MEIVCPTCNTEYTISNQKTPLERTLATCKKCGGQIVMEAHAITHTGSVAPPSVSSFHESRPSTPTETRQSEKIALIVDYPDLQNLNTEKFDIEAIFSRDRKGGYRNRKNNLKLKILRAVHTILDERILRDGEKVMRIGKGTAFYSAEVFFGNGFLTMMYNTYALVSTNQRLLFININSRIANPTHYFFQMPYENVRNVKRGLFSSSLQFDPAKGKRRSFMGVKSYLSKELEQFIKEKKQAAKRLGQLEEFCEDLCPSCFVPLRKGLGKCPQCKVTFKEPKKAFLRSLFLPGLGDIYLGHRGLGTLELIGSVFVWAVALFLLRSEGEGTLVVALFLLLFYNGVDGLLTYHMANKGYMLAGQR